MMYSTRLTSKGTTTIPAALRKKLGLKPGMSVTFTAGKKPGQVLLERSMTLQELRALNKAAMKRAGTWDKEYYSGAGMEAYVLEKYGKKSRD